MVCCSCKRGDEQQRSRHDEELVAEEEEQGEQPRIYAFVFAPEDHEEEQDDWEDVMPRNALGKCDERGRGEYAGFSDENEVFSAARDFVTGELADARSHDVSYADENDSEQE